VIESSLMQGFNQVRCLFDWKWKEPTFETLCVVKKLHHGRSRKKKMIVSASFLLFSLFWISWLLKLGLIYCPEMSLCIYRCTLCNISSRAQMSHDLLMQAVVWLCMIWVRAICFAAFWLGVS